jgi:hypothetical protein
VTLDGVRVRERGLPLGVLVIEMRELEASGLVRGAEVLVDERAPELLEIHGSVDGLDCGHFAAPSGRGAERTYPAYA